MYIYDEFDEKFVRERVRQFRGQVEKRLDGSLTENEFKPLRLMNGLFPPRKPSQLFIATVTGSTS